MMKENMISVEPEIGTPATICHWTDRSPATVIKVTHNGRRLVLQADKAIRIDKNGMTDVQSYLYEIDPEGTLYHATLRKDGSFRLVGSKQTVSLGSRRKYHDYSF